MAHPNADKLPFAVQHQGHGPADAVLHQLQPGLCFLTSFCGFDIVCNQSQVALQCTNHCNDHNALYDDGHSVS